MTTVNTWDWIRWRALAHVGRDILLYADEEPIRVSLVHGFVEDALGSEPPEVIREASNAITARLVSEGLLSPQGSGDSQLAITESGNIWVRSYYEHLEKVVGKRPAV